MKKTLLYILILLVIVGLIFYALSERKDQVANDRDFKIESAAEVYKVYLENKVGDTMLLVREDEGWELNNAYVARNQFVNELLFTLENIYVEAPVADVAHDNVVKQMTKKSTKVSLYGKGDKTPYKTFWVGGMSPTKNGTNFLMEVNGKPAERVFVVKLPGHNGFVSDVFHIDESLWRERQIFSYAPSEISSVGLNYLQEDSVHSFILENDANNFTLSTPDWTFEHSEIDQSAALNFLMAFSSKSVESFHNEYASIDSVKEKMPYAILSITDTEGDALELPLFYMPLNMSSTQQLDEAGNPMPYDVDKLYAEVNSGRDWALIQRYTFKDILVPSNHFLLK